MLDCALEIGDGDAILAVTLMIKKTLKHSKFLGIVCSRPLAAENIVNHMITRHELSEVMELLIALGRFHQAGIVGYRKAISPKVGNGTHVSLKMPLFYEPIDLSKV